MVANKQDNMENECASLYPFVLVAGHRCTSFKERNIEGDETRRWCRVSGQTFSDGGQVSIGQISRLRLRVASVAAISVSPSPEHIEASDMSSQNTYLNPWFCNFCQFFLYIRQSFLFKSSS